MRVSNTKCYSADNERFIYTELGELFADMESEGNLSEGQIYYEADCKVCESKDYATSHTISWILENLDEQLCDDVGEYSDNDFYNVPTEAKEELRSLLETWVSKHVNVGNFWKIIGKTRECVVTKDDLS
jgi:hypothetical protein